MGQREGEVLVEEVPQELGHPEVRPPTVHLTQLDYTDNKGHCYQDTAYQIVFQLRDDDQNKNKKEKKKYA